MNSCHGICFAGTIEGLIEVIALQLVVEIATRSEFLKIGPKFGIFLEYFLYYLPLRAYFQMPKLFVGAFHYAQDKLKLLKEVLNKNTIPQKFHILKTLLKEFVKWLTFLE